MLKHILRNTLLSTAALMIAGCGACDSNANNGDDPDTTIIIDTDMGSDADSDAETPDMEVPDMPDTPDMDDDDDDAGEPDMNGPDPDMGSDMDPDMDDGFNPVQVCLADCEYDGPRADEVDCDYDGLSNEEEFSLGSDPCDNDTDGDGLTDLREIQEGTDLLNPDTDGDGLNDADELFFEFDPKNADTLGDGTLDGDRWIVNACDDPQSEPVDYYVSAPGDWQVALPPAFSNYSELTISTAMPMDKLAAAVFDDTANEVTAFILSSTPDAGQQAGSDILLDYVPAGGGGPLRQVGSVDQGSNGGDFFTHDFHSAAIGRYLVSTGSPISARQFRDQLLFAIAPFDPADVTGLPNSAGATYTQFRVFISASLRESDVQGNRVITTVAVAPASKYDSREKVQFRMDDLTNTTGISSSGDLNEVQCAQFRAGEGNPQADFYWVLDQSGSMSQEYDEVRTVANQFFAELSNTALDYRLGVTNMDATHDENGTTVSGFDGRLRVPPSWHTDLNSFLGEIDGYVESCSGCDGACEFGLKSAKLGIEWMRSSNAQAVERIRPDAQVITIFMSDEEDQDFQTSSQSACFGFDGTPPNTAAGQAKLQDFKNFYQNNTIAFSIIGDGSGCGTHDGEAYREVALATGGSFASLCDTDPQETIEDIIFAATGIASNYVIPDTPISSTLRVFKNDEWVPRSRSNGFDYFAQSNSIAFFGTYRPEPADPTMDDYGDDIAVSYQTFIDTTKD